MRRRRCCARKLTGRETTALTPTLQQPPGGSETCRSLGHTVDAVFAVCVWLFLLALNPHSTLSIGVLWPLILTEVCHGWQRLDTRRVAGTGASLGSYSITPDSLGRAKKLLCLRGTFLAVLPLGGLVRTLGRCILLMALPLAVEGARQAFKERVIYVSCSDTAHRGRPSTVERSEGYGKRLGGWDNIKRKFALRAAKGRSAPGCICNSCH